MKKITTKTLISALIAVGLAGCAAPTITPESSLKREVSATAESRQTAPIVLAKQERVTESPGAYIPLTPRRVSSNEWLKAISVKLVTAEKQTLSLSEVVRMLARQGLNIAAEMPLDRYTYAGYSLNDVDAETALKMVLGSSGLDYHVDSERRLVTIKPLSTKTWYLNLGNKKTAFATDGGNNAQKPGAQAASAAPAGGMTSKPIVTASGSSTVSSMDDFWKSLREELDSRLMIMVPDAVKAAQAAPIASPNYATLPQLQLPPSATTTPVPIQALSGAGAPATAIPVPGSAASTQPVIALQQGMSYPTVAQPTTNDSSGSLNFTSKKVGMYSLNPETGAITVQAPHWIMQELDTYFSRVQSMYNTDLMFQGELVLLTTDVQNSEGLDITSFAKFAKSRYGLAYAANGLGGVTISTAQGVLPKIATGAGAMAGPLLGLSSPLDGFQIFNAYLTNIGQVTTLQKPVLSTTSGTPAIFKRTSLKYYNTISQETAGGGSGSATQGTKNILVPQEYGTILRVNPRYDIATGLIRAQIELLQTTQTGSQIIPQAVTAGTKVETINADIPTVSELVYQGEALLRDGDLIVMGGQTEDIANVTRNGITGLMDSSLVGGLFGTEKKQKLRNVYYFALRVTVNKRTP